MQHSRNKSMPFVSALHSRKRKREVPLSQGSKQRLTTTAWWCCIAAVSWPKVSNTFHVLSMATSCDKSAGLGFQLALRDLWGFGSLGTQSMRSWSSSLAPNLKFLSPSDLPAASDIMRNTTHLPRLDRPTKHPRHWGSQEEVSCASNRSMCMNPSRAQ